jgi:hypothetical protein
LAITLGWTGLSFAFGAAGCSCEAGTDGSGGTGGSGASASKGTGDGGSMGTFSTGMGGGGDCIECSADLHSVLDCNGNVILTCPPDQGCSPNGTCVPACQSAAENKSTIGCDFYSVTPSIIAESRGSCFAAMIANTWTSPISIAASYGAQTIDANAYTYVPMGSGASLTYQPLSGGMLQPGQLGILFLSKYESGDIFQLDCPVTQALEMPTQLDATGMGQAFHITTTAPIVAYDVYPWGGSPSFVSSATLLLPTPTWGTNFVTADAWEVLIPGSAEPFTQIVAAEDATTVTMVPVANIAGGGGLPAIAANTTGTFTLNRGQVAQFRQPERLIGSVLQADKPVSVWGGSSCMNIPMGVPYCDAAHQQLLPVQSLGSEYVVVRYPPRPGGDDNAPVTFVGMVDGTQLTFDPVPPGAPATLDQGQMAIISWTEPFTVRSQDGDHPFYVAAHMTGSGTGSLIGDPEYVNIVPPAQYLNSYLFATDPTYRNTALVFARKKGPDGLFQDVNLQCLGPVTGWTPVGSSGNYEVSRFLIVQNGAPTGPCDNGVHTATSNVPFGLTVWGYDQDVSYAYPAGMALESINTVIVPPVPR